MNKIKELQKLIQNTDFGIDLLDVTCSDLELNFNTAVTGTGVYLRCKIVDDEQSFNVYKTLIYNTESIPISKEMYNPEYKDQASILEEIIDDLCAICARLTRFDTDLERDFKNFEVHSVPCSTKTWKQEFIGELDNLFGSPRTVILASGIKLIIAFEEETNLIKIVLAKGLFFDEEKTLLHGIVSETNYKEVLDIVENIYNEFRYEFYDVNGIVEELKHLDY